MRQVGLEGKDHIELRRYVERCNYSKGQCRKISALGIIFGRPQYYRATIVAFFRFSMSGLYESPADSAVLKSGCTANEARATAFVFPMQIRENIAYPTIRPSTSAINERSGMYSSVRRNLSMRLCSSPSVCSAPAKAVFTTSRISSKLHSCSGLITNASIIVYNYMTKVSGGGAWRYVGRR